jgi:uncharacterized protein
MTDIQTETLSAPPTRVVASADRPFWDAIDAGHFVLARCACGAYYTRLQACLSCQGSAEAVSWVPAAGTGTVRSFVIFDKAYHPYFATLLPYVVAIITLQEGAEILTNVIDAEPAAVRIGMPVRIVITDRGGQKIHQASARI